MSKIGYIRVSTEHQETARQQEIMSDYQVDRIFSEKLSGANADRLTDTQRAYLAKEFFIPTEAFHIQSAGYAPGETY